jgi:hypothetical protein
MSCEIKETNASTATVKNSFSITKTSASNTNAAQRVLTGSTFSEAKKFWNDGSSCDKGNNSPITWTGAPNGYSVPATVSVAADVPVGTYTIALSTANGTTQITNPTVDKGAKLEDSQVTNLTFEVVAPPPPSDTTAPTITPNIQGVLGNNGWYTSDVLLSWTVVDNESAISSRSGCDDVSITTDQNETTYTCTATSTGGTSSQSVSIKRDATAPTINGAASPAPNAAGWNNTDVTVSYTCSDSSTPGSGLATGACPGSETVSTEGANQSRTGTVTDQAGNSASTTVGNINIDKTAPEFNCDPASSPTGWQADNFTFNCTASDSGGSNLTSGSPATFQLSTTVAAGDETASASTGSQPLSDVADNSVTAGPFTGIKVDRKAPELSTTCPAGGPYQLGSGTKTVGPIGYSENGSGLDSTNSALSGQVDTSTVGEKSVTFTAKDQVGNVATPKTCKYNVNYVFSGFLQPINMTAHQTGTDVSTFKAGSTVPVKFKLTDANGNVVQPASAPVWVTPLKGSATNQAVDEDLYSLAATTGGTYRYDATAQQWIYNWSTKGASAGCYYRIGVTLDDGKTYYQNISLR